MYQNRCISKRGTAQILLFREGQTCITADVFQKVEQLGKFWQILVQIWHFRDGRLWIKADVFQKGEQLGKFSTRSGISERAGHVSERMYFKKGNSSDPSFQRGPDMYHSWCISKSGTTRKILANFSPDLAFQRRPIMNQSWCISKRGTTRKIFNQIRHFREGRTCIRTDVFQKGEQRGKFWQICDQIRHFREALTWIRADVFQKGGTARKIW